MSRTPKEPTGPPPGRLPDRARSYSSPTPTPSPTAKPSRDPSVFVRAPEKTDRPPSHWMRNLIGFVAIVAVVAVVVMVAWPRLNPRKLDAVERVADAYLKALAGEEPETAEPVWDRRGAAGDPLGVRISARSHPRPDDQGIVRAPGQAAQADRSRLRLRCLDRPVHTQERDGRGRRDARRPAQGQGRRREIGPLQEDAERQPRRPFRVRRKSYGKVFNKLAKDILPRQENLADLPDAGRVGQAAVDERSEGLALEACRLDAGSGTPCSSGRF